MNKLPMYHIIVRRLTCPILVIPVMDFLQETIWQPSSYNRRYHERETAVAMDIIDQLSTYIHAYVDNNQNKIY